jgi:hypothetical protein
MSVVANKDIIENVFRQRLHFEAVWKFAMKNVAQYIRKFDHLVDQFFIVTRCFEEHKAQPLPPEHKLTSEPGQNLLAVV